MQASLEAITIECLVEIFQILQKPGPSLSKYR